MADFNGTHRGTALGRVRAEIDRRKKTLTTLKPLPETKLELENRRVSGPVNFTTSFESTETG